MAGDAASVPPCFGLGGAERQRDNRPVASEPTPGSKPPDVVVTRTLPCTVVFEEHEWQGAWAFVNRNVRIPDETPTLGELVRLIRRLGGHLGRKRDGPPGPMTMWRGLQRLPDIAGMWLILRERSG